MNTKRRGKSQTAAPQILKNTEGIKMLDYELYADEYEFFSKYCADDEIFDLTPQPDEFNFYWWEL